MSDNIKDLMTEAENEIEDILSDLHDAGVKVARIQILPNENESPNVNIVLGRGGK